MESGLEDLFTTDELDILHVHPACVIDSKSNYLISKCSYLKLYEDIYTILRYPKELMMSGIGGTAVAQFIITKEGKIDQLKLIRADHPVMTKAVLEAFEKIKAKKRNWRPGIKNGLHVNSLIEFAFSFQYFER